ncbi:urocanate hydratase [Nonomuraea sp. NPDC050153]|uniref:urocanate hydratase n=1 Tax=Nonomuraea sp. NPDC050153 TaxID=3364359 RepID=UPI003787B9AD
MDAIKRTGEPAPRGDILRCKGWEQEGVLRCLLNTLDPAVAEDSARLIVYGGQGRAARSWADVDAIVAALERLGPDETLLVQSGRPVLVLPTHPDAPRVLISTAMVVPAWSGAEEFRRLEEAGLTMYGQMTAASWFYIGTQGILGFTHETLAAIARRHFDGTLTGRRVVTAGLGGMGGAQGLAIANLGGRALLADVDRDRVERRLATGWVDRIAPDYAAAVADLTGSADPAAIALIGNIADVLPRLVADGIAVDVATDQTAAHDLDRGYIPLGYDVEQAQAEDPSSPAYRSAVQATLKAHAAALLALRERGTIVFEYGNNLRAQAVAAGAERAAEIPGFVAEYVRPILARGVGPYRWICLSGDPADLRRSEEAVLEVAGTPGLERWFALARKRVTPQGLPARICWLGLGERHAVGLRLNDLVRRGEIGPLALGRDHMDPASVASPTRETEGMRDGSDAIADWPILSALLNTAQGATWVAVGNGGGVGVGRSVHSGQVVVADGSALAERKIRRVFWADPALGVARYADAGYEEALSQARRHGLDLPRQP